MKKLLYAAISISLLAALSLTISIQAEDTDGESALVNPISQWPNVDDNYRKPPEHELKKQLGKLQFKVTQKDATERAFQNAYWDNKREGIYVDVVSGEPLFSSTHKYKSGTGWPSFTRPIRSGVLTTKTDHKLFYTRTELRSRFADSHLGHVFNDGPKPTGLRYCINSAALRFVPREEMEAQGYGEFLSLFEK